MNAQFLTYLIESSVYLLFFLVVYRFAIAKLTHFTWMRGYLLSSLVLSTVLPLVKIPAHWVESIIGLSVDNVPFQINVLIPYLINTSKTAESVQIAPSSNPLIFILTGLSIIYILGAIYKTILLFGNINKILNLIKKNGKKKEGSYVLVDTDIDLPAFSFFNFIFVNKDFKNLTNDDILRIKNHEIIHAKQWHTLDILFVELISVILWFNPLVRYTKTKLQEIHEYIADEETAGEGEMKKNYAQLLFNLATEKQFFHLMTGFSSKQISNRILMVTQKRSIRWTKLLFISLIPIASVLLLSFSYLKNPTENHKSNTYDTITSNSNSIKIRNIVWVNNKVVSSPELNKIFGIKKGQDFNKNADYKMIANDVTTYYNDKGYLFANVELTTIPVNDGEVDFTITVQEGDLGKIGTVQIKGNKIVPTNELLSKVTIKPGDLFSRSRLIESIRGLAMSGKLDPSKVKLSIQPEKKSQQNEFVNVNIVFEVTEL
jgi:beta-lactamase regulating signal transducer with metallopeptidase domain